MTGLVYAAADTELATLVGRVRQGDRWAEQQIVLRYQRAVRALVRRHCRPNEPHAEDLVQEVLADIVQRLRSGSIEDPQALPQYLQVAIVNACRAHYRRIARFPGAADPDTMADRSIGADPADARAQEEQSALLRTLVAELPMARDREILRRFYLLEESREDVCAALGIDEAHFRRVVHRARERLRESWVARHGRGASLQPGA